MSKLIFIIWNITEKISIYNKASSTQKNTDFLQKDNIKYIKILDRYTSLFERFFQVAPPALDLKWVDLIYNSPKTDKQIFLDIKTQTNITNSLNLYFREFMEDKLQDRDYIIFNKTPQNELSKAVYYISSDFIKQLHQNKLFSQFLQDSKQFNWLTQNLINQIKKEEFQQFKTTYSNQEFQIDTIKVKLVFLPSRKDKFWTPWNTNFSENIKLEITP
jgi:hypothetical protein